MFCPVGLYAETSVVLPKLPAQTFKQISLRRLGVGEEIGTTRCDHVIRALEEAAQLGRMKTNNIGALTQANPAYHAPFSASRETLTHARRKIRFVHGC